MDPLANINEQVELAKRIIGIADDDGSDAINHDQLLDDSARLAELVVALHEWRSKRGHDPYIVQ